MNVPEFVIREKVKQFLMEDISSGDLTSILVPDSIRRAEIIAKEKGIFAGGEVARIAFDIMDVDVNYSIPDGSSFEEKQVLMEVEGKTRNILMAERTVLNILMKMSGIATTTKFMVERANKVNPSVRIAATRKTTPGFRLFEKMAVKIAGGDTHRYGLSDAVLIKNNHIIASGGIEQVLKTVKNASFTKKIEVEVRRLEDGIYAAKEVDIIMFDNMKPEEIEAVVKKLNELNLREKVVLEASGNITPDNVEEYAKTGVDVISSGYITHSAQPVDMSLYLV
ncbi:MAG TPA: carboxylating nicotinate-nucleotide diphosphorylase [Archaeoglobaceae archaeon]|nr:carboxylating nicotinate-nucleotide diphosphorylase [Archaeoglobaceae archaeon]